jgi:hypothetical protein
VEICLTDLLINRYIHMSESASISNPSPKPRIPAGAIRPELISSEPPLKHSPYELKEQKPGPLPKSSPATDTAASVLKVEVVDQCPDPNPLYCSMTRPDAVEVFVYLTEAHSPS